MGAVSDRDERLATYLAGRTPRITEPLTWGKGLRLEVAAYLGTDAPPLRLDVAGERRARGQPASGRHGSGVILRVVRYGLPAALVFAGFVLLVAAPESTRYEGFSMCVGAGLALLLLNVLFRIGVQGDRDREREDAAREYFDRHGHWPDERRRR
jgi:hypothetical protein